MAIDSVVLEDRGVLRVAGEDAASFLQGLLTNDVESLAVGGARYAALLTPQGKILFDFLVLRVAAESGAAFLIDCPAAQAADLAKRLGFYRLRAKVTIADESAGSVVVALWGEEVSDADKNAVMAGLVPAISRRMRSIRPHAALPGPTLGVGAAAKAWMAGTSPAMTAADGFFADPRDPRLGVRAIVPRAEAAGLVNASVDAYEAHRIKLGVPKGGVDFAYADIFPHDANLDLLHGVDFEKGCYVGQEVVSRMRHRGGARKRIVRLTFAGAAPEQGTPVLAGETSVGALGSSVAGHALAMVRLDRIEDAATAGRPLTAGGIGVAIETL
jgi:folate-binding protein YgfZ